MAGGVGPLDEYPIHQAPLPVAWTVSSDRNTYDRNYFMGHHRTGEVMLISGIGYYPNLGVKDAFFAIRHRGSDGDPMGGTTRVVHLSDLIDDDRLHPHVGGYTLEVVEPLQQLRIRLAETEGISADLTWQGSHPVITELPHVMRSGSRVTLDAQRFAQVGTWSGSVTVDGETFPIDPDVWVGTRDRSWGIRPSGEAEPAGAPQVPTFEGMWWLYTPLRFDDYAVCLILQEDPSGHRSLNDCTRVWHDGRVEQLGWPHVSVHYTPGTRNPVGATIRCTTPEGEPVLLELEARLAAPLHVGCGYGGDPDWNHGVFKGADFAERIDYDMRAAEVAGRFMFGMVDHVGRATLTEKGSTVEGWGLFEHGSLGRHDPSGFTDWFTLAP